jgi:UDP-2,3-diacylglucosamine hydrolase
MSRPDYIASDIHLGVVSAGTARGVLGFFRHVGESGRSLLLAGDLFDFWFEWGEVVPARHYRVLAALADLVEAGIPVTYAGGNHDAWGGRFLREEVGVAFHLEPFRLRLGGRTALVAHGDGLGRGDVTYRVLKRLLRSRLTVGGFRVLHPELGMRFARLVSSTDTKRSDDPGAGGRSRFLAEWAAERLREDPSLDLVVCGHAHQPVLEEHDGGRWYINAGDWLTHFSYAVVADGAAPALRRWPVPVGG